MPWGRKKQTSEDLEDDEVYAAEMNQMERNNFTQTQPHASLPNPLANDKAEVKGRRCFVSISLTENLVLFTFYYYSIIDIMDHHNGQLDKEQST